MVKLGASIWMKGRATRAVTCDGSREKNFCLVILICIQETLWSRSSTIGVLHEESVLVMIHSFDMMQMVTLFSLKRRQSLYRKFQMRHDFEVSSLSSTM